MVSEGYSSPSFFCQRLFYTKFREEETKLGINLLYTYHASLISSIIIPSVMSDANSNCLLLIILEVNIHTYKHNLSIRNI